MEDIDIRNGNGKDQVDEFYKWDIVGTVEGSGSGRSLEKWYITRSDFFNGIDENRETIS